MSDYDRLLAALDEDRNQALLLLADACLDEGRPDEARGWGWLASRRKWPCERVSDGARVWLWGYSAGEHRGEHILPQALFQSLTESGAADAHRWRSAGAALRAVVDAVAQGRWQGEAALSAVELASRQARERFGREVRRLALLGEIDG